MPRGRSSTQRLVIALLEKYREAWSERYGSVCLARLTGLDRRNATNTVRALGLDEACVCVVNFLADGSRWLVKRRHPLKVFLAQVDRYGGEDGKGQQRGTRGIAKVGRDFDKKWNVD